MAHWKVTGEVSVDSPPMGKGKHIGGIVFTQGPGCTWQVTWKDGETQFQGDFKECTSRRFNHAGKTNCVSFMSQEVKEQEQQDLTKN